MTAVSQSRATEPDALGAMMRRDLDWVVMKSLDKDRSRRYETASALADGNSAVESEAALEPSILSVAQITAQLADPEQRSLFGRAAAALGCLPTTLNEKMRRLGLRGQVHIPRPEPLSTGIFAMEPEVPVA